MYGSCVLLKHKQQRAGGAAASVHAHHLGGGEAHAEKIWHKARMEMVSAKAAVDEAEDALALARANMRRGRGKLCEEFALSEERHLMLLHAHRRSPSVFAAAYVCMLACWCASRCGQVRLYVTS